MFISSGLHKFTTTRPPSRVADDDMSSVSTSASSIDLHADRIERRAPQSAEQKPPIPLPAPAMPQLDTLKATPAPTPAGPWEEMPIKDLASLTTVQDVYKRAMAHSPRHGRKVVQAVLINGASAGVLAQQPNAAIGADKALNIGALLLKQFIIELAQQYPDRFTQEIQSLFFNLPHPPHFDDCFQFSDACRFQGILAGVTISGLAKLPAKVKSLDATNLRVVTDAFGVHINSVLGRTRVLQRHMPILWPAGHSLAKAMQDPKYNGREHVFRFVATLEDFMLASNVFDAREFNMQMLKTLRHCMV